jgi:Protein of unknown function (DUF2505)
MSRSFDLSVESPASVDQVLSAFGDEDYWQARLATFGGGTATLDALNVDPSGTVAATITISLLRDRLPKMVTQLHRGDLEMVRNERWSRLGDGRVRGDIKVSIPGAPFSALGEALVAPAPNGSQLSYTTTVEVKIPLVGGKIESYIGGQTSQEITALQRFTTEWIAENY